MSGGCALRNSALSFTSRSGSLFPVRRRRSVWALGRLRTPPRCMGKLCSIRGLYSPAQLVPAKAGDPGVSACLHRHGDSLRISPHSRLENTHCSLAEWNPPDTVRTNDDLLFGSESPPRFFCFFGRGRGFPLSESCGVPLQFGQSAAQILIPNCGHRRVPQNHSHVVS